MAYGQFTSYEPNPEIPGAYNFKTADGKDLTFGGPEAEHVKSRIDAFDAAHTVAGPGGGDAEPGILSKAADAVGGFARSLSAPTQPAAATSQGAPAAKQSGGGGYSPVMSNGMQTGYFTGPDGALYKQGGGSPGVSEAQLQKKATQGVAMPSSESATVQGARPINEEYLDERTLQNDAERFGMDEQRHAEMKAAEAGQQAQNEQLAFTSAQQQQQQAQVSAIQAHVDQAQATRDAALKDYTSTKIDPTRIFSGGTGALKAIGAAIAAGAGAWAATMGHTQNFAQQIIDQAIGRDIAAQEADLRTKKDASDTALADLTRRGMSLDQAKNTLATIQNNYWAQHIQQARAASSNDAINAKWDQQIAQFDKKNADFEQAYRDDAMGKATQTVASQVAYPHAGSAGGMVQVGAKEAGGVIKDVASTEGTIAGTAKTIGEAEAQAAKAAGGAAKPNVEKNQDDQAQAALRAAENADPGGHIFFKDGPLASEKTRSYMAHVETAATQIAQRLSGGKRPNPQLREQILNGLTSGNDHQRKAFFGAIRDQLKLRSATDLSNAGAPAEAPLTAADVEEEAAPP